MEQKKAFVITPPISNRVGNDKNITLESLKEMEIINRNHSEESKESLNNGLNIKINSSIDNDTSLPSPNSQFNNQNKINDSDSDSDVPLSLLSNLPLKNISLSNEIKDDKEKVKKVKKVNKEKKEKKNPKKVIQPVNENVDSDSDSDIPLSKRGFVKSENSSPEINKNKRSIIKIEGKNDDINSDTDSDDIPLAIRTNSKKLKLSQNKSISIDKKDTKRKIKKESKDKQDDDEDNDKYKWWLNENKENNGISWKTLSHNGPYFPPEYEPHGIKLLYEGKPINLSPPSEEVVTFYAAVVNSDIASNPTFRKNFFNDFLNVLKENEPKDCIIKEYSKCDFSLITEYLEKEKERKKAMTKVEKQVLKDEKAKIDDQYGWAILDGHKEKVGNFRIEPPGLFRGRGEHPRTGCLKKRILPEQVTLNIGKGEPIPEPPVGHKWGGIQHDNTVTWLAVYKETVNDGFKYVFLAANSSLKGKSDLSKFEKARELKKHIKTIRADYARDLKDKKMFIRQRATAMYLIDRFALRAGNEKGDDEADTVGCCSLRYEHISLEEDNKVVFDFLGKDSIRYYNEVQVASQVWKNLKLFKKSPKKEGDPLFDRLNTSLLNKHLSNYMAGLSAKVFRTYNASHTFQIELKKTPEDGSINEKVLAYQRANRQVAILCNHQRAVPKTHDQQMGKIVDKIKGCKYEIIQFRKILTKLDSTIKKKRLDLYEEFSDLDEEFINEYEKDKKEKLKDKIKIKLEKENIKRKEKGLDAITKLDDSALATLKGYPLTLNTDRCIKKIELYNNRISSYKLQKVEKDENKTTALGTSKINYIDPRISAAWCYKYDVPIEKIFNKTLRDKFQWALDVKKNWSF